MKKTVGVLTFLFLLFMNSLAVNAHPGNTDSNGGHTCRTNCERWGLNYDQYHYHGVGTNSIPEPSREDSNGIYLFLAVIVGAFIMYKVTRKGKTAQKNVYVQPVGDCPKCGRGNKIKRSGEQWEFIGCTNYQSCDFKEEYKRKCWKCGELKSQEEFYDENLKSKYGKKCRNCKGLD